jgi:hypothetical protein
MSCDFSLPRLGPELEVEPRQQHRQGCAGNKEGLRLAEAILGAVREGEKTLDKIPPIARGRGVRMTRIQGLQKQNAYSAATAEG